jgi:hypothetical protein
MTLSKIKYSESHVYKLLSIGNQSNRNRIWSSDDGRAVSALGVRSRKHRSEWPVIGWVTKIYYLELLRASESTLGLTSGMRPVVKVIAESLSQHDEKHVVPTPLSGVRVGRRR